MSPRPSIDSTYQGLPPTTSENHIVQELSVPPAAHVVNIALQPLTRWNSQSPSNDVLAPALPTSNRSSYPPVFSAQNIPTGVNHRFAQHEGWLKGVRPHIAGAAFIGIFIALSSLTATGKLKIGKENALNGTIMMFVSFALPTLLGIYSYLSIRRDNRGRLASAAVPNYENYRRDMRYMESFDPPAYLRPPSYRSRNSEEGDPTDVSLSSHAPEGVAEISIFISLFFEGGVTHGLEEGAPATLSSPSHASWEEQETAISIIPSSYEEALQDQEERSPTNASLSYPT